MTVTSPPSSDATRLVTPAMLVLWLVLATVPLWIARVGLYPYLGIEILIWSLYALAFKVTVPMRADARSIDEKHQEPNKGSALQTAA